MMFALAVVVVLSAYLFISFLLVRWAIGYAKKNGKSRMRWGAGAALAMFMIPCWDWLPTVAVHQYYCAKESGFWVYKTLDQWKAENPGVMEGLTSTRVSPTTHQDNGMDHTTTYLLNQRFNWVVKKTGLLPFNRWRWEQVVEDSKTKEVLARYVDFSTGNGFIGGEPELRFWLHGEHCSGGEMNDSQIAHFFIAAKNLNDKGVIK
ncbi:MAG: hypothetical protein HOP24_11225 [Sideroxydans sp.]|nr:hypothetical protein [Sideroxydans sp.]